MRTICGLLVLVLAPTCCLAADVDDARLFEKVMSRLLSSEVVERGYPATFIWPPRYVIKPDSTEEVNAYASAHESVGAEYFSKSAKVRPIVLVTQGMLHQVVKGDENGLAIIMGHELAHLAKEHVNGRKGETALLMLAFNREQEIEADLEGLRYAVSAGYPYRTGVAYAIRQMRERTKYSSFEGLSSTHPTWEDRLAILDREQSKIWSAMSAFRNGAVFLELEQYLAAQQCYKAVTKEFPDCHEAWANLGYAQLMHYCDGLDQDDIRSFGIGQIVAGAFYTRPVSLESKVRGVNEKLWKDAVANLSRALELKPDLVLPQINLGMAYLVHPEGKRVKLAQKRFADAYEMLRKDDGRTTPLALASLLVNSGVAELAAGDLASAKSKFNLADGMLGRVGSSRLARSIDDALLYNLALVHAASRERADKQMAGKLLGTYLREASPDSAWWPIAYERYVKLAKELDIDVPSRADYAKQQRFGAMRLTTSVNVGADTVTLSEPIADVVGRLGKTKAVEAPLFPDAKISRWRFAEHGLTLLAKDKVLAIHLTNSKAPPVALRATGAASKPRELRVGMPQKQAEEILKDEHVAEGLFAVADASDRYKFYPELGLALRFEKGEVVAELIIAQIPRFSLASK